MQSCRCPGISVGWSLPSPLLAVVCVSCWVFRESISPHSADAPHPTLRTLIDYLACHWEMLWESCILASWSSLEAALTVPVCLRWNTSVSLWRIWTLGWISLDLVLWEQGNTSESGLRPTELVLPSKTWAIGRVWSQPGGSWGPCPEHLHLIDQCPAKRALSGLENCHF